MTGRTDALALLGLTDGHSADERREAYHRAARRLHPDAPDAPEDANERMVALNLAYRLLSEPTAPHTEGTDDDAPRDRPATTARSGAGAGTGATDTPAVELLADGSLLLEAPADETFERLLEAVEAVGDPTYVDTEAGLLQIIVTADGSSCYVTFALQGRANGTEVFTTVERLDGGAAPDPWPLLVRIADALAGA